MVFFMHSFFLRNIGFHKAIPNINIVSCLQLNSDYMKQFIFALTLVISSISFSQTPLTKHKVSESSPEWVKYMYSDTPNLYKLIELYTAYYQENELVKSANTQYYKRFVRQNIDFVDLEGNILDKPAKTTNGYSVKSPTSPWEEMGPWDYDHDQAMTFLVQSPGAAHVYTVEQSPVDANLVFVGTANAGVWKSTDKGLNWFLKTQDYDIQTAYSIALHPVDGNILLMGEGNGQIWRSTDGGDNWAVTGSGVFQTFTKFVRDLKYIDANNVLAATSVGLFHSTDGGLNWVLVNAGEHMEIEINPGNSAIIYSVKLNGDQTEFYKSVDGGLNWMQTITGWPVPAAGDEQKRVEIGVSADDPNRVYAWTSGVEGVNSGMYGFYISNDAGDSFTFSCCGAGPGGTWSVSNPNMLGWSEDGSEDGGQFYYDLAFAASPSDADRVFGSGINIWRSLNNGTDWELNGHWVSWAGANTVDRYSHADVHDIKFFDTGSGVDMWVASDGGVFYSADEGDHMEPRMHGIHGTDFWGFGAGFKDGDVMVGGTYHNGTMIKYKDIYEGGSANPAEGGWLAELGGDNYRGDVNFGDNTIGYSDNGSFRFSDDRSVRMTGLPFDNSKNYNASYWVSDNGSFGFDPTNYNHIYSPVGSILYESFDGGLSWTQVHDFPGGNLLHVHVSWANQDYIYVTQNLSSGNYQVQKSTDGGATWANVNPTNAEAGGNQNRAKAITLDPKNPDKLWLALMGNFSGDKVFESTDGGDTWTSISSAAINGENLISIHHQMGSDDGLYIGCYNNIFYKSDNTADWQEFSNNLPMNIENKFLTTFYGESKIRVAGNRGVYQCDFYEDADPIAMIAAETRTLNLGGSCEIDSIQYVDHSTVDRINATWNWTFEGGSPVSSTLENPKVYYLIPGIYRTKLVVSDVFGTDSIEIVNFIEITNVVPDSEVAEDFNGMTFPPTDWKISSEGNGVWERDYPENDVPNGVASFPNYWEDAAQSEQLLIHANTGFHTRIGQYTFIFLYI